MPRRVLLLGLVAVGLASGVGAAFGASARLAHDATGRTAVLARGDLVDAPTFGLSALTRDALERDHDLRRDVVAVLATVLAAALACGWRVARDRDAAAHHARRHPSRRPRAPPRVPVPVHC
jgi:hypothetical protein